MIRCKNCNHLLEKYPLTAKATKRNNGIPFSWGHKRENDLGYCMSIRKGFTCGCTKPEPKEVKKK